MNPVFTSTLRSLWAKSRGTIFTVLIVLLVVVLIRTFLLGIYYIPSGSMLNTLQVGDRILVSRLHPGLLSLHRGDVIVFRDKNHWIPESPGSEQGFLDFVLGIVEGREPDKLLIKRVIGLPGDNVACCSKQGRVLINGAEVNEESYLFDKKSRASGMPFNIIVPRDRLWVLGDNRNNSADSRAHIVSPGGGFIPIGDVVGKALMVFWPFGHFKILDNYQDSVFKDIPPK